MSCDLTIAYFNNILDDDFRKNKRHLIGINLCNQCVKRHIVVWER